MFQCRPVNPGGLHVSYFPLRLQQNRIVGRLWPWYCKLGHMHLGYRCRRQYDIGMTAKAAAREAETRRKHGHQHSRRRRFGDTHRH